MRNLKFQLRFKLSKANKNNVKYRKKSNFLNYEFCRHKIVINNSNNQQCKKNRYDYIFIPNIYIYNISIYYVPVNIIFIFIDVLYFYMHKYLKLYTLNYWHGFHRVIREIKISLFQSIIISYYCFIYQLCFLVMRTNIKQPCIFNIIIKK